jgi:iron complex outermembrane receptor protein
MSPAQAAATAAALAPGLTAALAPAPLGTVTFQGQTRPDVLATYASVSGKSLDVWGVDVGYDYLLTDSWTVGATYSWLCGGKLSKASLRPSCTIFPEFQGGNGLPYMSNAPANKGTVSLKYTNDEHAYGVEVRGRYSDAFPINSGVYYSDKDIPAPAGSAVGGEYHTCSGGAGVCYQYPSVPVIMTLDLGFHWRLPIGSRSVMWSLNGTNIFDNKRATFDGTPEIGRLIMTRLSYKF